MTSLVHWSFASVEIESFYRRLHDLGDRGGGLYESMLEDENARPDWVLLPIHAVASLLLPLGWVDRYLGLLLFDAVADLHPRAAELPHLQYGRTALEMDMEPPWDCHGDFVRVYGLYWGVCAVMDYTQRAFLAESGIDVPEGLAGVAQSERWTDLRGQIEEVVERVADLSDTRAVRLERAHIGRRLDAVEK